jgi:XTP/dITP diphosphohydrolase
MDRTIVLATRNAKKQRELQQMLQGVNWSVLTLADFPACPEVIEDGRTFLENAAKKAVAVSHHTGHLTLADDSGLEVDALQGAPGVYSARYARGEDSTDEENLQKVLLELQETPDAQRTARFVCAAVLAKGNELLFSTQATVAGIITREKRGEGGFGYDPIFFYPPYGKTLAQVSAHEKHEVSHRGKALRQVVEFLQHRMDPERCC